MDRKRTHQDPLDKTKSIIKEYSLFCGLGVRYFKRNVKNLLDHVEFYSSDEIDAAVGALGEHVVSSCFTSINSRFEGRNTNEYQGKKWTSTDHNLDFIASKDGIAYGIEVKNTFDYIDDKDSTSRCFRCVLTLGIIPVCIFRFARYDYLTKIKQVGGQIFMYRSKLFPLWAQEQIHSLWEDTLLPVAGVLAWRTGPPGERNWGVLPLWLSGPDYWCFLPLLSGGARDDERRPHDLADAAGPLVHATPREPSPASTC